MNNAHSTPIIFWADQGELAEQDCACSEDGAGPRIVWESGGELAESDCACPDHGDVFHAATRGIDSSQRWQRTAGLYRLQVKGDYQCVFNPVGETSISVLNAAALRVLDAYERPQTPAELARVLPEITAPDLLRATEQLGALGLLQPDSWLAPACHSEPQTLTAWLHVTNACNLRCTYCYLNKTNAAMDEATGRAAIEAVFRSALKHQFRTVKFKYAGGEATLNFSLVKTLHASAKQLSTEHGLHLREVVLSNGIGLTPGMLDFMRDENIRLMISLDGIGAAHNAQRVFANGAGSFLQVSRSIERAVSRGLLPHLSITVTARNVDSIQEVVAFALDRDLLFNLNFFRETNCAISAGDMRTNEAKLIAGIRRAFGVIEARLPRRSLIATLVDRASFNSPHDRACGAGHSYLVIDERGGVARCQMEIERTITNVFDGDPLLAVHDFHEGFQNIPAKDKQSCKDCEWHYWCAGGCSLLTFKATGRNDIQSPYCRVYKALYPDVIRLEGLRLLKWRTQQIQ